jgi:uncharacterized protein YkwD
MLNRSRHRTRWGAIVAVVLALAVLGAACAPKPAAGPSASGGSGIVGDIINRLNSARAQAGLPGFAVDGGMNANAQMHANRMAAGGGGGCGNLYHSPELGAWYAGHSAGENVACASPCPGNGGQFVSMWLSSPPHRANIMNGGFRYIGVGAACNGRAMYAAVQFRN